MYEWYKSKHNVPKCISGGSYFLKSTTNDNIQLADFENQKHLKVNAFDLFLNDMIKQRRNHY